MDAFNEHQNELYAEAVSVRQIADTYGTPTYVYSTSTLKRHYFAFANPLLDALRDEQGFQICYAVKANSNVTILQRLAQWGSGFDVVSKGELQRVLAAGGQASRTIFSGVGKSAGEIQFALEQGIECINLESASEMRRVADIANTLGIQAPVAVRVNPDVDANTHPYISTGLKENKFGVDMSAAESLCQRIHDHPDLKLLGIGCHIGSQLLSVAPFVEALNRVLRLFKTLLDRGMSLTHLDLGGGLGVPYDNEVPPSPKAYVDALIQALQAANLPKYPKLMFEPGRAIAANAGILVTRVEYIKKTPTKNFIVVDAAMNDLLRPSLYAAWQAIVPVVRDTSLDMVTGDVVGPVCETGDFLGKERTLPVAEGSLLAVRTAGAYGFTMSSNYNTRNRAAEVLVDENQLTLIRQRETFADQIRGESFQQSIAFTKMQGLGNDFLVVDSFTQSFAPQKTDIQLWSDRRLGIGFDQLLWLSPASDPVHTAKYRIFNADGEEAYQCGNGARCAGRFLVDHGFVSGERGISLEMMRGLPIRITRQAGSVYAVDMGAPIFDYARLPFEASALSLVNPAAGTCPDVFEHEVAGIGLRFSVVSMGNPHAVIVVDELGKTLESISQETIATWGRALQQHPCFPEQVNVGLVERVSKKAIRLRVFERGAGETLACGTGACAAVVLGQRAGWLGQHVAVSQPGGDCEVSWQGGVSSVMLTGPAETVFNGTLMM